MSATRQPVRHGVRDFYETPIRRDVMANDEWRTPRGIFAQLAARYGPFGLDVAATPENTLAPLFYTRADDGLRQPWGAAVWCNPPYSKAAGGPGPWVRKALEETRSARCPIAVLLVPVDATAWWDLIHTRAADILYVSRRIAFLDQFGYPVSGNRHASAIAVFSGSTVGPVHYGQFVQSAEPEGRLP